MQGPFLRLYGTETTIDFTLYKLDGTGLKADAAYASGDVNVMKDEGAEAASTNGFTDEGQTYSIVLTAAEMTAARVALVIVDQSSPQVWLDTTVVVETYGNASSMHPQIPVKTDLATPPIKKNTALAKFAFVMLDATTGLPVGGKTVTCTRSIDDGTFAAGTLANVAEQAGTVGVYCVDFGAGDLNGTVIVLKATATGCKPTFVTLVPWQ